jgi:enoyl-CoA hydratase/carnithine racemase
MGASVLLPRLISPQKAFEYLLAGSTVSGAAARDDGLVLEAVSKELVLPRAVALAESLSANAPIAVQTCLTSLRADKVPPSLYVPSPLVDLSRLCSLTVRGAR